MSLVSRSVDLAKDFNPKTYKSRQINSHDCGIHTAIVMERLYEDALAIIEHTESEISSLRKQICLRMLNFSDEQE